MAILKMHSFDYTQTPSSVFDTQISGLDGTVFPSASKSRTGPQSLSFWGAIFGDEPCVAWQIGDQGSNTVWTQGVWSLVNYPISTQYAPSSHAYIVGFLGTSNDAHVGLFWGNDNYLRVYRGSTPVVIASAATANPLVLGNWNFIEMSVYSHNSAGTVKVKLNGVTIIDASGLDTKEGSTNIGAVSWGGVHGPGNGSSPTAFLDDLVIGNSAGTANTVAPGDCRVEYLVPIGSGSLTHFTPSVGTNWSNVDESGAPTDTDYNYSADVGATDLFAMSNLGGIGLVYGVQSVIRSRKDDAGYRRIRPAVYKFNGQGNTPRLYGGTDIGITDSYVYYKQIFETSPDTAAAWTVDEVNDLQFGYTIGGGSHFSTDAWIEEF